MSNGEQKIAQAVSQGCPKCNGPRKSSKLNLLREGHLYVNFGGRIRNRDSHRLYAVRCMDCNFVEIYAD